MLLLELQDSGVGQRKLDLGNDPADRSRFIGIIDRLNDRFGRGAVALASAGLGGRERRWTMRQALQTPKYTTR